MRGAALVETARDAVRRRPDLADLLLATALAALVTWEILATDVAGPLGWLVPLGLLATLPLAVRRLWPLAVLVVICAAIVALDLVSEVQEPQTTLLPLLLAVYSVGAHAGRALGLAGLAAAVAAIAVDEPDDLVVMGPLCTLTWLAGRLVRDWRRQARELASLAEQLERERADTARLAVSDERARIARELHDVVGHSLSLLVLQAGAERLALGSDRESTGSALGAIERSGRAALAELRRLVGVLRHDDDGPEMAPLPGLDGLPALAEQVRSAGLPVELTVTGRPVPLPGGLDVSAYRIVQEALTNAVRHATGATRATVCVGWTARELCLEVCDDGRPVNGAGPDGHGLIGMRERVALFGGSFTAGRRTGGGWVVRAGLPLDGGTR
jgi:signal transduction histidine kinase